MPILPRRSFPLVAAALALFGTTAIPATAGEALSLLARAPQDLVATRLLAPDTHHSTASLDRAPASLSWPLDRAAALDGRPQAYSAASREYWIDADEGELRNGIRLPLSASGAVVRISPHGGGAGNAIAMADVQVLVAGHRLDNARAIRSGADEDALRGAGMDVPQGSVALRLGDEVAGDDVRLALPTAHGAYLVHVFEPASTIVLGLAAERDGIAGGDRMRFRATIAGATLERVGGLVSAPDGASQTVDFGRQPDGSYVAEVTPDVAHAGGHGLWEMHAFGITGGKNAIPRDAKTAFAVSRPLARLEGGAERVATLSRNSGLALSVGVETGAASRYGLSGVLYGTGNDGKLHPVAMAQSAAWLDAGHGRIELRYDAASLSLGAPWEVRDLRLVDQADMSLQERRERAFALQ